MKLKLTNHFQTRLNERNINLEHVKLAIKSPDSKEAVFEDRIKVTKVIDGKVIEVVYFKDGFRDRQNEYLLITAYYK